MTPEALAALARLLDTRGHSTSSGGNLSARTEGGFLVSGTGSAFSRQRPGDFARCDFSGRHLSGPAPSKEVGFHAAIYRLRPEMNTVLHVHANASLALSCLAEPTGGNVLPILSSYAVTQVGRVPLVPYFPPGSVELVMAVEATCVDVNALLLQNHGALVWAETPEQAVDRLEELEQNAQVWLLTHGQARVLTDEEVAIANDTAHHRAQVEAGEQRPRLRKEVTGWQR